MFPRTICFQASHSISFLGENLASAHHLGSNGAGGKQPSHANRPAQLWQEVFPLSEGKMHLKHHCQVNPQGNPSWSEAAHVLYPKPGAWPVTSVQACTEETETQQLIHFPPTKLTCSRNPSLLRRTIAFTEQSYFEKRKRSSTSSGILLSAFMSPGGMLSIQTHTAAFQDHLADLGQLWSGEKYFPPVIFMMAVNLSSQHLEELVGWFYSLNGAKKK